MKKLMLLAVLAMAALLALSADNARGASMGMRNPQISEADEVLPPECRTKTRIARILPNALPRAWVFIYNFEVDETGCVLVYDRQDSNRIQGYKSIDRCTTIGAVDVISGTGIFRGNAYIKCDVNLMNTVNAISGTLQLTETAIIDGFYMLGRGILSPTLAQTPTQSNLIVSYVPTDTTREPVSLRVFVTETGATPKAQIGTRFNGNDHTHPDCWAPVLPQIQKWAVTRSGFDLRFWYNVRERCTKNFPKIDLAQNGGTFYIGGREPTVLGGVYLRGLLDEVIVDPFDGVGPPGLEETFLPMMLME